MRVLPASITSGRSCFDPSGLRLVSIEFDEIAIVDLLHERTVRVPFPRVCSVAAFADEVWAATSDHHLVRIDPDGRGLGDASLEVAATGVLIPAVVGSAAAAWTSYPCVSLVGDGGRVEATPLDADLALPLTGHRHVIVRGPRVTMPTKVTCDLPSGSMVLGGTVSADGASVVLLVTNASSRHLLVISTRSGQIVQRCKVPTGKVRVATQRLVALVQLDLHGLSAIDLRTGKPLGQLASDRDIDDFTIAPDGSHFVTHRGDDCELLTFDEAFVKPRPVVATSKPERDPRSTLFEDAA